MTRRHTIYSTFALLLTTSLALGGDHPRSEFGPTRDVDDSVIAEVNFQGIKLTFWETEFFTIPDFTPIGKGGVIEVEITEFETGLTFFGGTGFHPNDREYIATERVLSVPGDLEVPLFAFNPCTGEVATKTLIITDLHIEGEGPVSVKREVRRSSDLRSILHERTRQATASAALSGDLLNLDLSTPFAKIGFSRITTWSFE